MGKKFSVLKANFVNANALFSSKSFFEATGTKLQFRFTGRAHHFRVHKNLISVYEDQGENPSKLLGYIALDDIQRAINIAEYILAVHSFKPDTANEDNLCCICLDKPVDTVLICGHGYCEKDIVDWGARDKYCPMCRQTMNPSKMYTSLDNLKDETDLQQSMEELFKLFSL